MLCVFVYDVCEKILIKVVLVYVDMYWFVVVVGDFDYLCELCVLFGILFDVVWVDLIFGKCLCVFWIVL